MASDGPTMTEDEFRILEHDMEVFVELFEERTRSLAPGQRRSSFDEVEQRVRDRRRADRLFEKQNPV